MDKIAELKAKRAAALAELRTKRVKALEELNALATKEKFDEQKDKPLYEAKKKEISDLDTEIARIGSEFDTQIARVKEAQELAAKGAQPVNDQVTANDNRTGDRNTFAQVENDRYVKEPSLVIGGIVKMLGSAKGSIYGARIAAKEIYGDNHPVTKALAVGSGVGGGFMVAPDYVAEVIPLLRAIAVVRGSGPRNLPMPRGTMTLPGQASGASASYSGENVAIAASQPGLGQIIASYKKLTGLVPVSNDMMRYASPATDAFVRDDLIRVLALREDLAFLLGDGTLNSPRGLLSFANSWVQKNGGTSGIFLTTAASTMAVNGADPANTTGGNFITSTSAYTLVTVAQELGGAVNRLDTANVPDIKRVWFMNPRSFNYLYNVQNSLGVYVYRDELNKGTLLGYPFKKTTQIGTNYNDASAHTDCSFVMLVEMDEAMILDSMQLELAVSMEGTYVDSLGATISAFQSDQTIIRAIEEHDFQMRHDQAVAVIQGVRWAPAIS